MYDTWNTVKNDAEKYYIFSEGGGGPARCNTLHFFRSVCSLIQIEYGVNFFT